MPALIIITEMNAFQSVVHLELEHKDETIKEEINY